MTTGAAADRLGEAGAGGPPEPPLAAPRLRDRRARRPVSNLILATGVIAIFFLDVSGRHDAVRSRPVGRTSSSGPSSINVLLAVFNMIPIPPLDGGNVAIGLLPPAVARGSDPAPAVRLPASVRVDAHRASLGAIVRPVIVLRRSGCCSHDTSTRGLGHAPDRQAASRASGRRAAELGRAAARVRLLLLRRRLARADERLRRHRADSSRTRSTTSPTGLAPGSIPSRARSSSSRWCRSTPSCTCCSRWSRRSRGSSACRPTRSRSSSSPRRICRTSASSAIRCCRRPTSSSTTRTSCRSARIRCRTSSSRARSCAGSTTSTARSSSSRSRCSRRRRACPASTTGR